MTTTKNRCTPVNTRDTAIFYLSNCQRWDHSIKFCDLCGVLIIIIVFCMPDFKAARGAKRMARKTLAEMVGIEWWYLANIENQGAIPNLPVMIQLIKVCGLPVERYFNPEILREELEQWQRGSHKLKLCPKEYLPIIEGAIDGAVKTGA